VFQIEVTDLSEMYILSCSNCFCMTSQFW